MHCLLPPPFDGALPAGGFLDESVPPFGKPLPLTTLDVLPFDDAGHATRFPMPTREEDALLTLPPPFDVSGPAGGALG